MKNIYLHSALATVAAMLLVTGCSKQEPVTSTPPSAPTKPASPEPAKAEAPKPAVEKPVTEAIPPAATPVAVAPKPVETAPPPPAPAATLTEASKVTTAALQSNISSALTAQKIALTTSASNQLQSAAATVTNQFDSLLERAKSLSANQKYQEALTTVQQIYDNKLTPEQKKSVDGLKEQIQAALAKQTTTNVTSVIGNILGGKK